MILIQVVCCSEVEPESDSLDEGGVSDDNCEVLTSDNWDKSSDNGIALDTASEVEGVNLGSEGE
jgi:hypothetical protein